MYQREQLIEQLGIQDWPEEKQNETVDLATFRIGDAVTNELSEQQFNEYNAIVDDNTDVIDAWLAHNVPDYKDSPVYKEFEEGYDEDPEKNNPAKLFASMAWVQVNVPNVQDVIARTLDEFKKELASSTSS